METPLPLHDESASLVNGSFEDLDKPFQDISLLQAVVFLEDAYAYRSITHKLDKSALILYRFYHSSSWQYTINVTLFILHLLAFFEWPSSLSMTADISKNPQRLHLACGITESVEIFCLLFLFVEGCFKCHFLGFRTTLRNLWLLTYFAILFISVTDWCFTMALSCGAANIFRVRRILRPFFLIQNSSLIKKTIKCLRRTAPLILSILLLVALHLYVFTLLAICFFQLQIKADRNVSSDTTPTRSPQKEYFGVFHESLLVMFALLTTSNNPDIMMPVYNINRLCALFFIFYLAIGRFCYLNMLLAVMYDRFREYFTSSIQTSLFRRRLAVQAAYKVLQCDAMYRTHNDEPVVSCSQIRQVILLMALPEWLRSSLLMEIDNLQKIGNCMLDEVEFQQLFKQFDTIDKSCATAPCIEIAQTRVGQCLQRLIRHRCFGYFSLLICVVNVVSITVVVSVQNDNESTVGDYHIQNMNAAFVLYYLCEQSLTLFALGCRNYCSTGWNIYDGLVTMLLVLLQAFIYICMTVGGSLFSHRHGELSDVIEKVVNMLIVLRLLRYVTFVRSTRLVMHTLADLLLNMRFFLALLVLIYYVFGIIGVEWFAGLMKPEFLFQDVTECGSYSNLKYGSMNFDDFWAAIVTLWSLMVVNNWHVIANAYGRVAGSGSIVYFVLWWLVSVIVLLNLFTAFITENFLTRAHWYKVFNTEVERVVVDEEILNESSSTSTASSVDERSLRPNHTLMPFTMHDLFRDALHEPGIDDLRKEVFRSNTYLCHLEMMAIMALKSRTVGMPSYDDSFYHSESYVYVNNPI